MNFYDQIHFKTETENNCKNLQLINRRSMVNRYFVWPNLFAIAIIEFAINAHRLTLVPIWETQNSLQLSNFTVIKFSFMKVSLYVLLIRTTSTFIVK